MSGQRPVSRRVDSSSMAVAELRIGREGIRQELDRDGAVEARVPRALHLAHAEG